MCGRYTLKTAPDQWGQLLLPMVEVAQQQSQAWYTTWEPRYNIAPTQPVLAIFHDSDLGRTLDYFRWGLVPSWAKDLSIGNRMINARSETIRTKNAFSESFSNRRCTLIADGYYEWQKLADGSKQACWMTPKDEAVVGLAGVWDLNSRATGEVIRTCTIVTTSAIESMSPIHDRSPIPLVGNALETWLNPQANEAELADLLAPAVEGFWSVTRVGNEVNNPRNESSQCIAPVPPNDQHPVERENSTPKKSRPVRDRPEPPMLF